jgi:hypothetical protein
LLGGTGCRRAVRPDPRGDRERTGAGSDGEDRDWRGRRPWRGGLRRLLRRLF